MLPVGAYWMCPAAAFQLQFRIDHAVSSTPKAFFPASISMQVLLLMWTQNIDLRMQVQAMELFSGEARVSQALRGAGVHCVSYDLLYDASGKSMNFLSPGGFAFLACVKLLFHQFARITLYS